MTAYEIAKKGELKEKVYQVLKDNDIQITNYEKLVKVVNSIAELIYGS